MEIKQKQWLVNKKNKKHLRYLGSVLWKDANKLVACVKVTSVKKGRTDVLSSVHDLVKNRAF